MSSTKTLSKLLFFYLYFSHNCHDPVLE